MEEFFNRQHYPFWKKNNLFPLVDQSVYNYLLPTLALEKSIKLGTDKFFIWAESDEFLNLSVQDVIDKKVKLGLVHWAGCLRSSHLNRMIRGDVLRYFEDLYYKTVPFGTLKKGKRKMMTFLDFSLRKFYHNKIKKFINFNKL